MRSILCVVLVAACLVAWECRGSEDLGDGGLQTLQGGSSSVATTTTVDPKASGPAQNKVNDGERGGEPVVEEPAVDEEAEEEAEADKDTPDAAGVVTGQGETPQQVVLQQPAAGTKTTGTTEIGQTVDVRAKSPTEVKTTTTATPVKINSSPVLTLARGSPPVEPKPEEKSDGKPEKHSGGQKSSEGRGQPAAEPAVTAQTTIVKKNNGDIADKPKTSNSGDKGTDQQPAIKSTATTTNAEQTSSTETSTTSSVNPTKVQSTKSQQSTIQQNLNNKDSTSSTSLVLAFATLATLAMILAAPVY